MKEPDRKRGGTFIRDENGKLLQHIPPTRVDLGHLFKACGMSEDIVASTSVTYAPASDGTDRQHIPPTRVDLGPQPKPEAPAESTKPTAKPAAETPRGPRGSKE